MRTLPRFLSHIVLLSLLPIGSVLATESRPPNVIVILTDDQGFGAVGANGNDGIITPEMDKLHADSVRLTDFHVDPTCAPTRGALMTGRYSSRVGVWMTFGSRDHLRRDEVTMADVFQQNGYTTAIFGKWHLGTSYPFRPMDRGFDESFVFRGGVIAETPDYWDNDYYDDFYFRNGKVEQAEGYCTDVWFNSAMEFIEENQDKPFFVYIATNAAHAVHHVPQKYKDMYQEQGVEPSSLAYSAMLTNVDENLGKLREQLNALSLERETIVIFMTDNGTAGSAKLGVPEGSGIDPKTGWTVKGFNAGMRGRKGTVYEGGHRVFCFVRWPQGGLVGGRDVGALTAHIDLMPTLIDLCDLDYKEVNPFDGVSIRSILENPDADFEERTLTVHHQAVFGGRMEAGVPKKYLKYNVMRGDWRLVGNELYNIKTDIGQRNDVAAEYPEVAKTLQQEYETWWSSISERFDEYCPFVINPNKQKVVKVSSQGLMGAQVAYSQRHVRGAMPIKGSYAMIDVEVPGRYRIALRRWPIEADAAICDTVPARQLDPTKHVMKKDVIKALDVVQARLQVIGFDQTQAVSPTDKESVFEVDLEAGEQRLQTWFTMKNGDEMAAYYTYIELAK